MKSAIPFPSVNEFGVVPSGNPVNNEPSPTNEPLNEPVSIVSATNPDPDIIWLDPNNTLSADKESDVIAPTPAKFAAVAPNATVVEPIVTLLATNCEFATPDNAPPNVITGSTVSPSEVNVKPF